MSYPPRPMAPFQNNVAEMFLGWASTKIAKIVPLHSTKWPPELKTEKPLNKISSQTNATISNYKFVIPQECSLDDSLQKMLKLFCSTEQNGAKSKNRKKNFKQHVLLGQLPDFLIILQNCFLGGHLPKSLKSFSSPELKIEKKPLYDISS